VFLLLSQEKKNGDNIFISLRYNIQNEDGPSTKTIGALPFHASPVTHSSRPINRRVTDSKTNKL